jgi:hypothetical protein
METKNLDVRLNACIILQDESEKAFRALCSKVKSCKDKDELKKLISPEGSNFLHLHRDKQKKLRDLIQQRLFLLSKRE